MRAADPPGLPRVTERGTLHDGFADGFPANVAMATAGTIGDLFLYTYLLPFELASLVLLAALIGAVVLSRKEIKQ